MHNLLLFRGFLSLLSAYILFPYRYYSYLFYLVFVIFLLGAVMSIIPSIATYTESYYHKRIKGFKALSHVTIEVQDKKKIL